MLASELDSLDIEERLSDVSEEKSMCNKENMTLDVSGVDTTDATLTMNEDAEWLLLECCFGIPLFESNINKSVCERIASHNLVNKER